MLYARKVWRLSGYQLPYFVGTKLILPRDPMRCRADPEWVGMLVNTLLKTNKRKLRPGRACTQMVTIPA
jgi:hypothetical protein